MQYDICYKSLYTNVYYLSVYLIGQSLTLKLKSRPSRLARIHRSVQQLSSKEAMMLRIAISRYDNYLPHLTWTAVAHCFNCVVATAQQAKATATRKRTLILSTLSAYTTRKQCPSLVPSLCKRSPSHRPPSHHDLLNNLLARASSGLTYSPCGSTNLKSTAEIQ